jgi:hypothetical protein
VATAISWARLTVCSFMPGGEIPIEIVQRRNRFPEIAHLRSVHRHYLQHLY